MCCCSFCCASQGKTSEAGGTDAARELDLFGPDAHENATPKAVKVSAGDLRAPPLKKKKQVSSSISVDVQRTRNKKKKRGTAYQTPKGVEKVYPGWRKKKKNWSFLRKKAIKCETPKFGGFLIARPIVKKKWSIVWKPGGNKGERKRKPRVYVQGDAVTVQRGFKKLGTCKSL